MAISYGEALQLLEANGQGQVLRFWERLSENERQDLLGQVAALDFDALSRMRDMLLHRDDEAVKGAVEPAPVVTLAEQDPAAASAAGEAALRANRVGVLLVAGGQGSRLGFDGPKGAYSLAPLSQASLFEIHSRKILAMERRYGCAIPFYIMTSETNDRDTRECFERNGYFGLSPERVMCFKQGMWPALDAEGRIILDRPDHIFRGPDGHGGVLDALKRTGMLQDMQDRQLDVIFYFQVDNALVEIADPAFVGLHCRHEAEIAVKVCAKRDPAEGLGVVGRRDGRNMIVEYTELTDAQKAERLDDGNLKFRFGSVAIHTFSVDFLRHETEAGLPLHLAHKKIPYCDADGQTVKPDQPNGFKFEKFIFDVLPDADRAINVEFRREEEFSPLKNASGADSAETARRDMVEKFARWFEAAGVQVPRGEDGLSLYRLEVDPCYALDAAELRAKLPADFKIEGDVLLK